MPRTEVRLYKETNGVVPMQDWLDNLEKTEPAAYAKCLDRILKLAQSGYELRRPLADYLDKDVYELRVRAFKVQYRMLYFFPERTSQFFLMA